ncbi:glycosyltransferase family 2 protein [Demequina gelatinilytica]|uniref:glycosyltransferase family 2 protein n=1 Tax=Demequina gelatinilytica TaxID=1638980 RepID=UPI0009E29A10|nr:glycosyltransferase family 2 protein [Demequina gelatinilytica]
MGDKLPITAVIISRNEESGIRATLERLRDFDQVIVVDSRSTDRTVEIAQECGATVVPFDWDGRYPKKKQWGMTHAGARHDWILLLDADELVTPELAQEIRARLPELARREYGAYDIRLRYKFAGRFLDHGHTVVKRSLVDRRVTRFVELEELGWDYEVEGHVQPQSDLPIGRMAARIEHDDRDPVESWFTRHNKYSGWEARLMADRELFREVAHRRTSQGRVWAKVPFKPLVFFLYSYVARAGFLDGRAGFDYAVALSMYYWQIGVKARENVRLAHKEAVSA